TAGAAAALLARGRARAAGPAADKTTLATVEALRGLVMQRALVSEDPWVLMHVVLALGPDAKNANGALLDGVVARYGTMVAKGGRSYPGFPINVEAHPNHFLEIMEAIAVPS